MIKAYFNEKAEIWDERVAEKNLTKLEDMAGKLAINAGDTVLDVGTGTGVFLPYILKSIGTNGSVVALDIAEEMLKRARTKSFNGSIDYLQADIMDIPLGSGIFDSVVCYSSFPHFRNKVKAITEINRVMKKGGRQQY